MSFLRNIVLLGFMGTGKSTVGRSLAQSLAWDFIDMDLEIEKVTDLSVSEIFRQHGETRFRSEERIMADRLGRREQTVVATGGGTVLDPLNWEALAGNGIMIWLQASLDVILERIGHKNDRPLLKGPREKIEKLWSERQECYARADFTVDTSQKNIDEVAAEIMERLGRMKDSEFSGSTENRSNCG